MIEGPVRRFGWLLVLAGWLLGLAAACPKQQAEPGTQPEPVEAPEPTPAPSTEPAIGTVTLAELGSAESLRTDATREAALALLDQGLGAADPGERWVAADALWVLPWDEARPRLERAATDEDPQVAIIALHTLAKRADPASLEFLRDYLNWEDLFSDIPAYHPKALRMQLSFEEVQSPIEALAQAKDPAVKPKILALLQSTQLRDALLGARLAEWYGIADLPEATQVWDSAVSQVLRIQLSRAYYAAGINREQNAAVLRAGFNPADFGTSLMLFNACVLYGWTEFAPEIRKVMQEATDPILRGTALETLGLLGQPLSSEEQRTVLADDQGRGNILPRLAEWGNQETRALLAEQQDPAKSDYVFILLALAQFGDDAAFAALVEVSKEKDAAGEYTKRAGAALNALADAPQEQALTVLREALRERAAPPQRHFAALQGLARRLDPDTLPDVVLFAKNYSSAYPGLAAWAAAIAMQLTTEGAEPSLPPADRLIWPLPAYGRYKPEHPSAKGGQ